ncbi:MAG TPA: division plane positioning ATPase MipZ, partial [Caulobacteraceae bacterium]
MSTARTIVIGNEKGGAGKSTVATHLVTALLHEGASVVVLDLDVRQRSTERFFANRAAWAAAQGVQLFHPLAHRCVDQLSELAGELAVQADFVVVDTP